MLTIDLESDTKQLLNEIAEREHRPPEEIAKLVISYYLKENQDSELLINIINNLPEIACFKAKDPLALQKAMRDETIDENKRHFLEFIRNIKPVKALYSSEEMVAMLREGKEG
jgi:hypothetical protein